MTLINDCPDGHFLESNGITCISCDTICSRTGPVSQECAQNCKDSLERARHTTGAQSLSTDITSPDIASSQLLNLGLTFVVVIFITVLLLSVYLVHLRYTKTISTENERLVSQEDSMSDSKYSSNSPTKSTQTYGFPEQPSVGFESGSCRTGGLNSDAVPRSPSCRVVTSVPRLLRYTERHQTVVKQTAGSSWSPQQGSFDFQSFECANDTGATTASESGSSLVNLCLSLSLSLSSQQSSSALSRRTSSLMSNHPNSSGSRWAMIMALYKIVEAHLYRLPWIVGCMISSTDLEVVVDLTSDILNTSIAKQEFLNRVNVPLHLQDLLKFSDEGPSIELCCGSYSPGCTIFTGDTRGKILRRAKVTMVGYLKEEIYIFTVAHILKDEAEFGLTVKGDTNMLDNKDILTPVAFHKTFSDRHVRNVRRKLYDLALLRTNTSVPRWSEVPLREKIHSKVLLKHQHLDTLDQIGRRVLIVTGDKLGTVKATILRVHVINMKGKFLINILELKSPNKRRPLEIRDGDSGSLVTSYPDAQGNVEAVAYLIGRKMADNGHATAIALPLWDAMSYVCEKQTDQKYFLSRLNFHFADCATRSDTGYHSVISAMTSVV